MSAVLPKRFEPMNTFPHKSLERRVFGQFVSWFYHSKGSFPQSAADSEGYVPLHRLLETATFRKLILHNPDIDFVTLSIHLLRDDFQIKITTDGIKIRAMAWIDTYSDIA